MSSFLTSLDLRNLDGARMRVLNPFRFDSEAAGGVIEVPVGFTTDFASIPRIAWRVIPKNGLHDWGAVVHDYLYKNNGFVCIDQPGVGLVPVGLSRAKCDLVFFEGMVLNNVPYWQREVMYWAVKIFGIIAWREHIKNNAGKVINPCGQRVKSQ